MEQQQMQCLSGKTKCIAVKSRQLLIQKREESVGGLILYDGLDAEEIKRQNELRFGTDGKIQYQSQVLTDYMDFLSNYGSRQATVEDKKVEERIAETIAEEMIEDNLFCQNKLKQGD